MRKRVLSNATSALIFPIVSLFCTFNPLTENCAHAQVNPPSPQTYSPQINPLVPDRRIRSIATRAFRRFRSNDSRIRYLFDHLKVSASSGLFSRSPSQPPSTASQTSRFGGDCSDLTLAFLSGIRYMNSLGARIPYGAQILNTGSPTLFHMVAIVPFSGTTTVADLSSNALGTISIPRYSPSIVYAISPNNSSPAAIYHAEWGDYFRVHRNEDSTFVARGIAAYRRSLELFDLDPVVHGNLAFLCDLSGDTQCRDWHNLRRDQLRSGN